MVEGAGKESVMFGLGYQELLIILVIVLILFGANRLPDLARSLGSSVKEFKKGISEASKDDATAAAKKEEEKKAS
jgi:sec-independent protein translocase protein TatA